VAFGLASLLWAASASAAEPQGGPVPKAAPLPTSAPPTAASTASSSPAAASPASPPASNPAPAPDSATSARLETQRTGLAPAPKDKAGNDWWAKAPPPFIQWLTAIPLLVFLWGLCTFAIDITLKRRDRSRDQANKVTDYWFTQIVVSRCVVPLCELVAATQSKLAALPVAADRQQDDEFRTVFADQIGTSIDGFRLLQAFDMDLYLAVRKRLEELEDAVELFFAARSGVTIGQELKAMSAAAALPDELSSGLTAILQDLLRYHLRITSDKPSRIASWWKRLNLRAVLPTLGVESRTAQS